MMSTLAPMFKTDQIEFLVITCLLIAFVVSLALPQSLRREWFGSNKRRYDVKGDEEPNRQQYVPLKNIDTEFLYAKSRNNDKLSPLGK